jgi:transposase
MTRTKKQSTEAAVREIRRRTRRKFAPEEKVRIVLEGLRGEQSISELCRREGIASNLYYRWSKDFLEAGKKQLAGDTVREASAMKSRICGPRTGSSRKSSPRSRSKIACSKKV